MTRSLSFLRSIFILSLIFAISACGGGGGSSSDTTPDSFSFTAETAAELGEQVESASVTITGIDKAVSISVSGGEYSINGGSFTGAAGTVSNGQSVQLRLTASDEFSSAASATLTVGGVSGTYTVTTIDRDITPENYDIDPRSNVALASQQTSSPVTISGINDDAPISIDGGEYSIAGGSFTSDAGTVSAGDEVLVRVTASALFSTPVTATLSVGPSGATVDAAFTVTTLAQDITPEAFEFTALPSVVRGSVNDSGPITITDINDSAPISVSGGSYSIEGADFTSEAGLVSNGQAVIVRVTASSSFSTAASATLSVGPEGATVNGSFTVTTLDRDDTPESFSQSPILDSERSTLNSFSEITVAGLNDEVDISITAGAFTINGGSPVTSGSVSNNDLVVVQLTSSASFVSTVNATLTIGSESEVFSVVTEAQDIAPAPVSINAVGDAAAGALVASEDITVSDINDSVAVSVTNGTFDIDGDNNFQALGNVTNGQVIRVRVTASSDSLGVTTATLNLGEGANQQSADFQVRTSLTFESQTDIEPDTDNVQSNTIVTLLNFGADQSVSVTNGEISVDGGAFVDTGSGPLTVSDGETIEVRADASSDTNDDVTATVTVGDFAGTYIVTTLTDTTAPTAEFVFPTPVTATEGLTLTVRGTAEDDYSDITSITVNVRTSAGTIDTVAATSLGDSSFAEWSAEVDLGADEVNTITVEATDSEENTLAEIATVSVTHQSTAVSFPNGDNRLENVSTGAVSLDARNNRLVVADADSIYSVDLNTGARTELIDAVTMPAVPTKVHVDVATSQIYITSEPDRVLMLANADGSGVGVFSDQSDGVSRPLGLERSTIDGLLYVTDDNSSVYTADTISGALIQEISFDDNFTLSEPAGLAIVTANTILVADQTEQSLFSVDISLGDGRGTFTEILGPIVLSSPQDVEYDSDETRAIFVDDGLDAVMSVPVAGGSLSVISDATTPNANNVLVDPSGIALDSVNNLVYVPSLNGIVNDVILVDLVSGERVVLSRSVSDPE